jgi:hypothetical protein
MDLRRKAASQRSLNGRSSAFETNIRKVVCLAFRGAAEFLLPKIGKPASRETGDCRGSGERGIFSGDK